jgi:hypothetical protein
MWRIGSAPNNTSKWKMGLNSAFKGLIRHKNIINHIKAQRLSWFGHLHGMPEERMVKKIYIHVSGKNRC